MTDRQAVSVQLKLCYIVRRRTATLRLKGRISPGHLRPRTPNDTTRARQFCSLATQPRYRRMAGQGEDRSSSEAHGKHGKMAIVPPSTGNGGRNRCTWFYHHSRLDSKGWHLAARGAHRHLCEAPPQVADAVESGTCDGSMPDPTLDSSQWVLVTRCLIMNPSNPATIQDPGPRDSILQHGKEEGVPPVIADVSTALWDT